MPRSRCALKSAIKHKTARFGMLCSKLSRLSYNSCLIEGIFSLSEMWAHVRF